MSGVAGIVSFRGNPPDTLVLDRLAALTAAPPDADRSVWRGGDAGFVQIQPIDFEDLDQRGAAPRPTWWSDRWCLVADARLDDRPTLLEKLRTAGTDPPPEVVDAELILASYQTWGDSCLANLHGDYVFAIWDARRRRLFCARDRFGVKPFFYASRGRSFIFSSRLAAVRAHPAVSGRLDEVAIGDFLLFDFQQDSGGSAFAEIRRLPPAHSLTVTSQSCEVRRYWQLPAGPAFGSAEPRECSEHLAALLRRAVADRAPASGVAISLSGGLDSPSVAAAACEALDPGRVAGFTIRSDRLLHDDEPRFAAMVARHLGFPIHYLDADGHRLYEERPGTELPEPANEPLRSIVFDHLTQAGCASRVVLSGHGGDALFVLTNGSLRGTLTGRTLAGWWRELCRLLSVHRGLRPLKLGARLRSRLGWRRSRPASYPGWLDAGFAARESLSERWRQAGVVVSHPRHPHAATELRDPLWPHTFETLHAGVTGCPVEVRYPFFDVRVVEFVLSLPPQCWQWDKGILRQLLRGRLPAAICRRPKASLRRDPIAVRLPCTNPALFDQEQICPELGRYINLRRMPSYEDLLLSDEPAVDLRPWALNRWLLRQAGAGRDELSHAEDTQQETVFAATDS